jgi:glycosyltransferase involved in cell wall biosynthesis
MKSRALFKSKLPAPSDSLATSPSSDDAPEVERQTDLETELYPPVTGDTILPSSRNALIEELRNLARIGGDSFDPGVAANKAADIFLSAHNYILFAGDHPVVGGVFIQNEWFHLWAVNRANPLRPVELGLVVDGRTIFEGHTDPASGELSFAAGRMPARHRSIEFAIGDVRVKGPAFAGLSFWKDEATVNDLLSYLNDKIDHYDYLGLRYQAKSHLPKTMVRLDSSDTKKAKGQISEFVRYMANKYDFDTKKLAGYYGAAQWVISEIMEYADRRSIFCMTNEINEALAEGVFNRRALKSDVSLGLFAFWRRHYQHIDIFTDEGLRKVQYKFATAPFISDKNNQLLITDSLKERLSQVADAYRSRALPWSWYWLFRHEDEGIAGKMMDAAYAQTLSFKEVVADLIEDNRCSFNPRNWLSYWGSAPHEVEGHFSRFDLALMSLLNQGSLPEALIAERGAPALRQQLIDMVYARAPKLAAISVTAPELATVKRPSDGISMIDLVIVGHANATGLGRNLNMFVDALAGFDPLIFNADDGQCVNPDGRYRPDMNLRARVALLCVNADRAPEMIARFAPILEDAHIFGFYLWETDTPPETHLLGANAVDEIWAPTEFVADGYRKITSTPIVNIHKGLAKPPNRAFSPFLERFRNSPSEIIFLTLAEFGSSIVRKNPLAVVNAFQLAFADRKDDVRLLLKMREIDPSHWSNFDGYWEEVEERITGDSRISVIEGNLTDAEYWSLIDSSDVFVSLHRAEGFGYGIADAMMLGKPVIVSDYSGSRDFCDHENSFPVAVDETPTPPEQMRSKAYVGHWASPRVKDAADAMRAIIRDREDALARGRKARERIFRDYSFSNWSDDLSRRIRLHLPPNGG